jgi:hypothetical protein
VCAERGVSCAPDVVEYVIHELHGKRGKPLLPCHPRDLLGMAQDLMSYAGESSTLTCETLQWAWDNYFVEETQQ